AVDLEQLDLAGLAVDAADRDEAIRIVRREPEIAVEIHPAVMGDEAELGSRPPRPVGAVVGLVGGADAGLRHHGKVVELPHDTGGVAARSGAWCELERALARSARTGEIGRKLLLIELDDGVG